MRQWADVYVPALDERLQLEKKALFFIPSALERCTAGSLNVAHLSSISSTAPIPKPRAGRNAIAKIFRSQPVTYESAKGFINVANYALGDKTELMLSTENIVACVFRLREFERVLSATGLSVAEVASQTGLSREVVLAAVGNYRLQLNDALAIWELLHARVRDMSPQPLIVRDIITDEARDFIKTDVRTDPPTAVRALDEFDYVYGLENLRPAPREGHYWALSGEATDTLL